MLALTTLTTRRLHADRRIKRMDAREDETIAIPSMTPIEMAQCVRSFKPLRRFYTSVLGRT